MLIIFLIESIVQKEFVPPGQAVNGKLCSEVLRRLRGNIRRKRPDRWRNKSWALHHYNARASRLVPRASRLARCAAVFGFYEHDSHPPPSLLTGSHPVSFSFNPEDEIEAQGATFDSIEEI